MYEIEEIDSLRCLDVIKDEWRALSERAELDIPFNRYEWYRCWWKSFMPYESFLVLAVRVISSGEKGLAAVLPLMSESGSQQASRKYRIWANTHSFRTALLADRRHPGALTALAEHLIKSIRLRRLILPYLVVGVSTHEIFKKALSDQGCSVLTKPGMRSPIHHISGDLNAMLDTLGRRRRESLRRKLRKLESRDGYRFEIIEGRADDLTKRLQDCWYVSKNTWKHARGSSIAADPRRMKFYECLAESPTDWVVLALSYIGDKPIAFEYNIRLGKTLYNLKLGFDEKWRSYSPGIVLRLRMLQWAFEQGVETFDYMGNSADYKEMLSTSTVAHEDVEIFSPELRSRAAYWARARGWPYIRKVLRPARRMIMGGRR